MGRASARCASGSSPTLPNKLCVLRVSAVFFFVAVKLGIYIQVPFCQTKCTYCNFHTGVFAQSLYAPYVNALCRELADHGALYRAACVAVPAKTLVPSVRVTGRSVFSRTVTQGTPNTVVSSCMPPESVNTSFALSIKQRNSR